MPPRKPNAVVHNAGPDTIEHAGRYFAAGWTAVRSDEPAVRSAVDARVLVLCAKPDPGDELEPAAQAAWALVDRKFAPPAEPAPPAPDPSAGGTPPAPTVPQEDKP